MDRDKFMKALNHDEKPMNREYYKDVIKESINSLQDQNPRGHHNLIICMEELTELQQALSKELRGKGDPINILEEIADVLISIGYIKEIVGLSDELIVSAINVKIDRLEKILNEGDKL